MYRVFGHYIPKSLLFLLLVEGFILWSSLYVGVELGFRRYGMHVPLTIEPLLPQAVLFASVMLATMTAMGLYQRHVREGLEGMLLRIGGSFVLGLLVMSLLFYFVPPFYLGRGAFGLAVISALVGISFSRMVFLKLADHENLKRRIMVLGAGKRAAEIEQLKRDVDRRGFVIVGFVHIPGEHNAVDADNILPLNTSLIELAKQHQVDEIVVAVEDRRKGFPVHEILDCKMSGISVMEKLTFFERQSGKIMLTSLQPSWLIFSEGFRRGTFRSLVKRTFDIVVSLLLLMVTAPLMVVAALAIWVESGFRGPILYRQVRVGENWRLFQVLKFRSMRVDAEKDGQPRWAQKHDPRVTWVGYFLRKMRVDELPQIINVLRGDMSFVGPRPERPMFVEQLSGKIPYYAERHRVRPGITGWAQICYPYGASQRDAVEKLQYDLYYVKNYSLFLDLMILFQTVEVVLWGKGAR